MNTQQIKMVRGMLAKAGLTEYKDDLAYAHSGGRTTSLTEMTQQETNSLVTDLNAQLQTPKSPADKMRNKILSLAHEMKWHKPGTRKVDMDRVNQWCVDKFAAPLDKLAYIPLCSAVTAFVNVHTAYLRGI